MYSDPSHKGIAGGSKKILGNTIVDLVKIEKYSFYSEKFNISTMSRTGLEPGP